MDSDKIAGMYMPNPKDVEIGEFEATVKQPQA